MATLLTRSALKALEPDLRRLITVGFSKGGPITYTKIARPRTSSEAFEKVGIVEGLGYFAAVREGQPIPFDAPIQGPTKTFVHQKFGLGVRITEEMIDDCRYEEMLKVSQMLGFSARQTIQAQVADIYNSSFVSTVRTAATGQPICSANHRIGAVTVSNLVGPAALSYSTLLSMIYNIRKQQNARGMPLGFGHGRFTLIIPIDLYDTAVRILESPKLPGTDMNDVSTINRHFDIELIVVHELTSAKAHWLLDRDNHDVTRYVRMAPTVSRDGDFDTGCVKNRMVYRHSVGVADPRGLCGNAG